MTATTFLVVAALGCCCLLSDAFVIRSESGNNNYNQVNLRRQNVRQIIYNPTQAPQRNVVEPTQVKLVAPTRQAPRAPSTRNVIRQAPRSRNIYPPAPRAPSVYQPAPRAQNVYQPAPRDQNVYPPAPRDQNVYQQAPRAQNVYPPAPRDQNVYPPAPRAQNVYQPAPRDQNVYPPAPRAPNVYQPAPRDQNVYPPAPRAQNVYPPAQRAQNVYPPPSRAIKVSPQAQQAPIYPPKLRSSGPHQGLPTVYEKSPNTQPQYTAVNRQSDYYRSQIDQEYDAQPFRASRRNIIRLQPFPQGTIIIIKDDSLNPVVFPPPPGFMDQSPPSLLPALPAVLPKFWLQKSPLRYPTPEPNSQKATPGLSVSESQDRYYENMVRLSMLAEMELPHYGGHNNLYQLAQSLGAPESQAAAQSQASKPAMPTPSSPPGCSRYKSQKTSSIIYTPCISLRHWIFQTVERQVPQCPQSLQ